ncbi:glycoside hydrolase family 15 protein [Methanocella sp. CWC-04]|uniref:Glycoside hydrolase family 15 protein n=1 Tax=Methanooceanicella nereidis TaxID=2052831 RepID=A0AAP2RD39_9EURY|nr:glycoside hydrolase family 15 protein [Methanocella sp. CWC-04]MCD1295324.1 glycoside hydrolase family 15 protein [Methanocella sp. CWC-04]
MRPLIYGNGSLLVCVDEKGVVRDFYYPYAGMENHGGYMRLGLYDCDLKTFGWLENWKIVQRYRSDFPDEYYVLREDNLIKDRLGPFKNISLIGETVFDNERFEAMVTVREMVHQVKNFFLRSIEVKNTSEMIKNFRLFSSQTYSILENNYANTAVRDGPMMNHYKRNRFFLHSSFPVFDQFTTGLWEWGDRLGTWKDAEDGVLEGNTVSQGMVDSSVGWNLLPLQSGKSSTVYFWVCVGENYPMARDINNWIKDHDIESVFHSNHHYWSSFSMKAYDEKNLLNFYLLPQDLQEAFARSLLTVTCHVDKGGSIIASCDSQIKQQGADYYSYCWPRDAAWVAIALDKAGYSNLSRRTYHYLKDVIDPRGYFRHKYTPEGDLGSTWHPLPMLQIDETGLPLYAVYKHWTEDRNIMTVSALYEPLVKPAANALMNFIDSSNDLPRPSFDLWEERKGIYTYSCACVYAGLKGASEMAFALGDDNRGIVWRKMSMNVRDAIIRELYDPSLGRFKRGIDDDVVDSSLFAVWYLDVVPAKDPMAVNTMKAMEERLLRPNGGIARYTDDGYQGYMNSWIICTLWLAQWYIRIGDLERARELLEWSVRYSVPGGLMPEQVGENGEPISVVPLTWSHSTFILAIIEYLEALALTSGV